MLTLVALAVWIGIGAVSFAALGVMLKRSTVRGWRRWLMNMEKERCDLANEPTFCGRQRT